MTQKRFRILRALLLCTLLTAAFSPAQAKEETVKITGARRMEGDTDGKSVSLEGELVAIKGKTTIYAPKIEYNKDTKVALFIDGVRLEQEDLIIVGEEFEVNFDTDQGVFRRSVRLERAETKDEEGEVVKDQIILFCRELELDTETKDFIAIGETKLEHKDFTASSPRLSYQDEEEKMIFTEGASLIREKEEIKGEKILVDLKKKTFEVTGAVELTFEVEKKESEARKDE